MIGAKVEGLAGRGHDTINCIMTWKGLAIRKIWSRYKDCIMTMRGLGSWALYRDLGHDTAKCARGTRPRHSRLGACDTAPLRPRYGTRAGPWAHLGAQAGPRFGALCT